jgi:arsenate reductase (glutaredoxin)
MSVTIFHNPACGTSRNTLALMRHAGIEPVVIEYLKAPPSKEKLRELVAAMGISVRELLLKRRRLTRSSGSTIRSSPRISCSTPCSRIRS